MEDSKVTLNETVYTQAQFEEEKKKLEAKPGVQVVRIDENTYRTRIVD